MKNYLITGYHGEPHVTAESDRAINAGIFGSGRFVLPVGQEFRAEYIGSNTIRMYDGLLLDNGAAAGIPNGEYVDFQIANAGQGMKRKDLIVFQYTKDPSTLIEKGEFVVVRGTETTGTAKEPTLTQGDLISGETAFEQMALWSVSVSGTTIAAPVRKSSAVRSVRGLESWLNSDFVKTWNGMGSSSYSLTSLSSMPSQNGWFYVGSSASGLPTGVQCGLLNAIVMDKCRAFVLHDILNGNILYRYDSDGDLSEWEWLNPPMVPNTEYRTTERYNGDPVYVKSFEMELTAGGSESISTGINNSNSTIIGISYTFDNGYNVYAYNSGVIVYCQTATDDYNLCATAETHGVVRAVIKYTK